MPCVLYILCEEMGRGDMDGTVVGARVTLRAHGLNSQAMLCKAMYKGH